MYTVSGIFYTKKKVTEHLLLRTRSVYRNVGKKVTGKKSHGKSHRFGWEKKSQEKSHKKYAFSQLLVRNNIFIFIIPILSLYVLFGFMF